MKKEKKTTAKDRANTSVGSRFPHLSASAHLENDVREDFLLTEREFGDKYRRGKQARLQEFENAENRLAVQFLTTQVEHMSPIVEALQRCAGTAPTLLDAAIGTPVDAKKAEAIYGLASIDIQRSVTVSEHSLQGVITVLEDLKLDAFGVAIFRDLICGIDRGVSATEISERFEVSRQTVSERRARLVGKLVDLRRVSATSSLHDLFSARVRHSGGNYGFSLNDPLVAISRIPNNGNFPSVVDVVLLGLWLASTEPDSRIPKGLSASPDWLLIKR
jgi:hypothetical protein